jgi:hypothetical protein
VPVEVVVVVVVLEELDVEFVSAALEPVEHAWVTQSTRAQQAKRAATLSAFMKFLL